MAIHDDSESPNRSEQACEDMLCASTTVEEFAQRSASIFEGWVAGCMQENLDINLSRKRAGVMAATTFELLPEPIIVELTLDSIIQPLIDEIADGDDPAIAIAWASSFRGAAQRLEHAVSSAEIAASWKKAFARVRAEDAAGADADGAK